MVISLNILINLITVFRYPPHVHPDAQCIFEHAASCFGMIFSQSICVSNLVFLYNSALQIPNTGWYSVVNIAFETEIQRHQAWRPWWPLTCMPQANDTSGK